MILLTHISLFAMILVIALMIINTLISKKSFMDREKSSPFECGFDPKSNSRMPFSLHFFLITVIFLIFDVEITLLLPMMYTLKSSNIQAFSSIFFYFIMILIIGVYHEWNQGALNWTK